MMVLFTSRSEKKALLSTRRILDTFADRIGHDTWRTVITKEGLLTVKNLLRQKATKSTAVACHWLRSRQRSQLLWIVGRPDAFDETGRVPVHTTAKDLLHQDWEGGWPYMPLLKALTAMAALLHDWGKASDLFQEKLRPKKGTPKTAHTGDPLRHEWISIKLLEALVTVSGNPSDDTGWITYLLSEKAEETALEKEFQEIVAAAKAPEVQKFPQTMPPLAQCVAWLILSHHRLPQLWDKNLRNFYADGYEAGHSFSGMLRSVTAQWHYANITDDDMAVKTAQCFSFSRGLLLTDERWRKCIAKWGSRLLSEKETAAKLLGKDPAAVPALRPLLLYAREALMLGDHYVSSQKSVAQVEETQLFANTNSEGALKQTLVDHLIGVMKEAVNIIHLLPALSQKMGRIEDLRLPRAKQPEFFWQDKAVQAIRREKTDAADAWFIVNMASTGCGKTFANAKIMQGIAPDGKSLRYILALGLRSLTLQTGTEYRERMGISADEFAVLIGSAAIQKLYENDANADIDTAETVSSFTGSSTEDLLPDTLTFEDNFSPEQLKFLDLFLSRNAGPQARKNQAFLYKPVLALTIDHLMGATETIRGGRHLLPFLRLMSSDLVIDEIDDFTPEDLTAIARLIHLAGLFGRNVLLSSATIPPDLAEGMYRAWQSGVSAGNRFAAAAKKIHVAWVDEFATLTSAIGENDLASYRQKHQAFIEKRVKALLTVPSQRKGYIAEFDRSLWQDKTPKERLNLYFDTMRREAEKLHTHHHVIDASTGKRISFGLIRLAHIDPCVYGTLRLLDTSPENGFVLRPMCYHSRQVLLLRHEQERYLDQVLHRKGEDPSAAVLTDPVLRHHIDNTPTEDILFIVVATPVEEIGRDHDFDWAVVEPSSYRSLIQLVGRLLRHRHRKEPITHPNLAVMPYNLRSLLSSDNGPVFCHPGFETTKWKLDSHNLSDIVDATALKTRIDAIPRIQRPMELNPTHRLIDLEHQAMADWQEVKHPAPKNPAGWEQEFWWLTGLPQMLCPFRASDGREERRRFYVYDGAAASPLAFCERDDSGNFFPGQETANIDFFSMSLERKAHLWLTRDYLAALQTYLPKDTLPEEEDDALKKLSQSVGELLWQDSRKGQRYYYSDQLGLFKKDWQS